MSKSQQTRSRAKDGTTTARRAAPPALPAITRSEANAKLRERATELFHVARNERQARIDQFESEYGRTDRIDLALLQDLQRLQMRFAAISARQTRQNVSDEPKVSRYTKHFGELIGELSAHLATERALELFAPVDERQYIGIGGIIGTKGLDESVLAGFCVVDDPKGPKNVTPTKLDDEESVCLHEEVEPLEDDPTRCQCVECGEEFKSSSVVREAA